MEKECGSRRSWITLPRMRSGGEEAVSLWVRCTRLVSLHVCFAPLLCFRGRVRLTRFPARTIGEETLLACSLLNEPDIMQPVRHKALRGPLLSPHDINRTRHPQPNGHQRAPHLLHAGISTAIFNRISGISCSVCTSSPSASHIFAICLGSGVLE